MQQLRDGNPKRRQAHTTCIRTHTPLINVFHEQIQKKNSEDDTDKTSLKADREDWGGLHIIEFFKTPELLIESP